MSTILKNNAKLCTIYKTVRKDCNTCITIFCFNLYCTGADLSIQSISGRTPLIQAIGIQNLPIIKMLLAAGADPNQMDSKGTTPLNTALISVGSTDMGILRILIEGKTCVYQNLMMYH